MDPGVSDPLEGNYLRAVSDGNDVVLDFGGGPASGRWRIWRDRDKWSLGSTPVGPDQEATSYRDEDATLRFGADFYVVRGLDPCTP